MHADELATAFARVAPACDGWSLRQVHRRELSMAVRDDLALPFAEQLSRGAMVTVQVGRASAYAATPLLSVNGLRHAAVRARDLARELRALSVVAAAPLSRARVTQVPPAARRPDEPDEARLALLHEACRHMQRNRVRERLAELAWGIRSTHLASSEGARMEQAHAWHAPTLSAVASDGGGAQRRTFGGHDGAMQGGPERLDADLLLAEATRVADEAVALLDAPPCPSGRMDLLLMPGQMVLQVHESIGHPLELDRILGDERNYAGGSFVTLDMFGAYRYGSELLNVTFDPTVEGELASYAFDDEGTPAERVHLIRGGVLQRPLGGALSQRRAGLPGTANARASDWNRPPMDRMANVNVEPGESSLAQMIAGIERGVLMDSNRSWSIDQSRNKFQFGCEHGRVIENGELGHLVRDPGYRGVSATFWRSLRAVGDRDTWRVQGTRWCGKGEPNQIAMCGHAVPACVFADVEVFGPEGE